MRQEKDEASGLNGPVDGHSHADGVLISIEELEARARAPLRALGRAPAKAELDEATRRAAAHLDALELLDGHWCGRLEGCTILESEYMLLLWFLHRAGERRFQAAADYLRRHQEREGGWPIFPHGPPEVSTSVKAYFALKLAGDTPEAPHMKRARRVILDLGGVEATNSFTKIYLSILGQYDWERCPAIPPEMILLPRWFGFNIYEMSSWSRAMVVPLSVLWSQKPVRPVPAWAEIRELFLASGSGEGEGSGSGDAEPDPSTAPDKKSPEERLWRAVFGALDRALKWLEAHGAKPLRRLALARAEKWLLERMEESDGVGAIFPPIVNTIFALSALGYSPRHPAVERQLIELEKLEIPSESGLELQPCRGPVWDTSLALRSAIEASPDPSAPRLLDAARWLLNREVRGAGDWAKKSPRAPAGGWFFQYANAWNPDCDDTAQILLDLSLLRFPDPSEKERARAASQRAVNWLLGMQSKDGGWAAFDRDCQKRILTLVPFADHNAMIDPSCPDITGRVLEALVVAGLPREHVAIRRGVNYLLKQQEPDGTWYGRWGCNYIYGTWLALQGLRAAGEDMSRGRFQRSGAWLRSRQQARGGFGESPRSYDDPAAGKGRGPATATQTAWALLGLFGLGDYESDTVHRGLNYLLETQEAHGGWDDEAWCGTGFPRVFYLHYHYYSHYFPLLTLARHRRHRAGLSR
jgi:squalene-hopene/tetraprenyl-beta-curcumene cyclase